MQPCRKPNNRGESELRAGFEVKETTGVKRGRGIGIEFGGFVGGKRRQRGVGWKEKAWIWWAGRKEREEPCSMKERRSEGERGKGRGGEVSSARLYGRVDPVSPARTCQSWVHRTGWRYKERCWSCGYQWNSIGPLFQFQMVWFFWFIEWRCGTMSRFWEGIWKRGRDERR